MEQGLGCESGVPAGGAGSAPGSGQPASTESQLALTGQAWQVTRIGERAVTADQVAIPPYLVFDPKGAARRVSGSAGCNRLDGAYRKSGATGLEFEDLVGTERGCEKGMDVEQALSNALQTVKSYRIVGRALELLDAKGGIAVQLEAR